MQGVKKEEAAADAETTVMAEEDWDAVYEAAKEEGKVVIYALSSRIFDAVEEFKTMYPGIEVEAVDIPTVQQIEKLKREQEAGVYNADVLLLADRTSIEKDILKKGYAINYVPAELVDGVKTEDVIPAKYREGILQHSIEAKVIFYNTDSYPEPPIKKSLGPHRTSVEGPVPDERPYAVSRKHEFPSNGCNAC